jgi:hypothetical protein
VQALSSNSRTAKKKRERERESNIYKNVWFHKFILCIKKEKNFMLESKCYKPISWNKLS